MQMDRSSKGQTTVSIQLEEGSHHGLLHLSNPPHHHHADSAASLTTSSDDEGEYIQLETNGQGHPVFGSQRQEEEASDGTHRAPAVALPINHLGVEHMSNNPYLVAPIAPTALGSSSPGGREEMKQPPPAQAMARPPAVDVPDPYRIPSSVFARTKSTAPMEWSVASNESLFSIHMGNSSFSRDHVFLLGKSGELPSYLNSPRDAHGNTVLPPEPPSQPHSPSPQQSPVSSKSNGGGEFSAKMERELMVEDTTVRTVSTPRHSDGSITSIQSFAFPILTAERGSMKGDPQLHQSHLQTQQVVAKTQQERAVTTATSTKETANSSTSSWCPSFLKCTLCCRAQSSD